MKLDTTQFEVIAKAFGLDNEMAAEMVESFYSAIQTTLELGGTVEFGEFLKLKAKIVPAHTHQGFGKAFDVPAKLKIVTIYQRKGDKPRKVNPLDLYTSVPENPDIPHSPMKAVKVRDLKPQVDPGLQNMIDGFFPDEK